MFDTLIKFSKDREKLDFYGFSMAFPKALKKSHRI